MGASGMGELATGAGSIGISVTGAAAIGALATSVLGTMISEFPTSACGQYQQEHGSRRTKTAQSRTRMIVIYDGGQRKTHVLAFCSWGLSGENPAFPVSYERSVKEESVPTLSAVAQSGQ
jgi:hypothetical protein